MNKVNTSKNSASFYSNSTFRMLEKGLMLLLALCGVHGKSSCSFMSIKNKNDNLRSRASFFKFGIPNARFVVLALISCLFYIPANAVTFPLDPEWDRTIGTTGYEELKKIIETPDGGYIMCGAIYSTDNDYWVVKVDALGNLEWEKSIGGSGEDIPKSIAVASDGGYLVGGYSDSGISGDKTMANKGFTDYWVVKLDTTGNILWDKSYGTSNTDKLNGMTSTLDGGYILSGESLGGIDGDKTSASKGGRDYWVIKIDVQGNMEWDKSIGGSDSEIDGEIIQSADGGYVISGISYSDISGDKTENAFGNSSDYWIVKIDTQGTIEWNKTIGSTVLEYAPSVIQSSDGGYLVLGESLGDISGDRTAAVKDTGTSNSTDLWMVKLSAQGAIQWDKSLPGDYYDRSESFDVIGTSDGGYFVSSSSAQGIYEDKTEDAIGSADIWVAKLDAEGTVEWDKTLGTDSDDGGYSAVESADGGFVVVGWSDGGTNNHKTEPAIGGSYDVWLVKLPCYSAVTNLTNSISPASQTRCELATPGIIVGTDDANLYDADISYQWQISSDTLTWTDIAGAIGKSYLPLPQNATQYYRRLAMWECENVSTSGVHTLTIGAQAAPVVTPGGPFYSCVGQPVSLSVAVSGGTPPYSYQWVPSANLDTATNATVTASETESTIYNVTVTDANGCSRLEQVMLNMYAADAGPDIFYCEGSLGVQIGAAPLAGLAGVTYSWSPTTGLSDPTAPQPIATVAAITTYTLTVDLPYSGGGGATCSTVDTVDVGPQAGPTTPNFAGADTYICSGQTALLGLAPEAGFTYTWAPGTYLTTTDGPQTTYDPGTGGDPTPNPITYTLTASKNGCSFVDEVEVATLIADAGADTCGPNVIGRPDGSSGAFTYSWAKLSGPGYLSNTSVPQPTAFPNGGTTVFRLTVSYNGNSCTDDISMTSCVDEGGGDICDIEIAVTRGGKRTCPLDEFDMVVVDKDFSGLSGDMISTFNFQWSPTNGLSNPQNYITGVSTTNLITYTVTMVNKYDPSISCTSSMTVNDPTLSPPSFTPEPYVTNMCPLDTQTIGSAPVAGYEYEWYEWDGSFNVLFASNSTALITTPAEPGTYNYTLNIIDSATQCRSEDYIYPIVVQGVDIDAGDDFTVCPPSLIQLGTPDTSGGVQTYSWTPDITWTNGTDATSPQPEAILSITTIFTLTVSNTLTGCTSNDQITVTVENPPALTGLSNFTICEGEEVTIGPNIETNVVYSWTPTTGLDDPNIAHPKASPSATTVYTVESSYPGSCAVKPSGNVTVTVQDQSFNLGADKAICPPGSVNIGDNAPTVNVTSYQWSPATDLSCTTCANPSSSASETTEYTLDVLFNNGCIASDTIEVKRTSDPYAGFDRTLCLGETATLGGSGNSGVITWSGAGSTALDSTSAAMPIFDSAVSGIGIFTLQISQTDSGCTQTDDITITVISATDQSPGIASACIGGCAEIGITAEPNKNYTWFPTNYLSSTTNATTLACPPASMTYQLIVEDTILNCSVTLDVPITIAATPAPTLAISDVEACPNTSIYFNPSVTPAGTYTYSWSPVTGLDNPYIENPLVSANSDVTYTLTVTDTNYCSAIETVNLAIKDAGATSAVFSTDAIICQGDSATLSVNIQGGVPPYTLIYSDGLTNTTLLNYNSDDTFSVSPTNSTIYNLVSITDSDGCPTLGMSGNPSIQINPVPTSATLSGVDTICPGGSTDLGVDILPANSNFYTIVYNDGTTNVTVNNHISGNPIPVSPTNDTTYTLVDAYDVFGCSIPGISGTASITVTQLVTAVLTSSVPGNIALTGQAVTFTASGADLYEFSLNSTSQAPASLTNTWSSATLNDGDQISVTVTDSNGCSNVATIIMTVLDPALINISKTVDDTAPVIGDTITYTLTITNAGPGMGTNIVINDALPTGVSYVATSIIGGDSNDDSASPLLTWTINTLTANTSTTLSYQASIDTGTEGQNLSNIVVLACPSCDTNGQTSSTNTITPVANADVMIQKASDVSNPAIGDTITYTLTLTNAGPSLATNILVSDSLPVGLSYVAASIDASGDDSLAPTLSWTLPSLAMGSTTTLSYQATLDAGTEGQSLTNIAVATCADCTTNQPPSTNIITASSTADVVIQKGSDITNAVIGDTITYTLTLTNAGPSLATNILVSDSLPVGLSYVAASIDATGDDSLAPTLSWTLPALAMGSTTTLSYQATLDAGTEGQSLSNIAVAACTDCTTNQPSSTNIITASATADVVIQKVSDVSNAAIGDTITYTLTLTNTGPSLATNILVSDSLPVGLSYVAASIDASGDDSLAPTLSWTLPSLAMGASTTLSYQATLDAGTEGQSLTNIAVATCADCTTNQPPSTNIITASATADVVIQKASDVSNAAIGDTITYTLTLTNAGPSLATNILVSDSLPVGLSYVAASIDASGDDSLAPTLSWTLPALAMGSTTTLSYQATLDAGTEGESLTNIAVAACADCNTNQPPSTNIITASSTADVVIQKASDVSSAAIGDTITYTLTVSNTGPSLATNILVSDTLPVGLTYVAASIDAMGDDSLTPTLSWTLPSLAMGSTTTLSYQATLDAGTEGQSLTNIAVAACADCNTNQPPSTNIITASTTADVVIQKASDVSSAAIGDTITYTLTLTNTGPSLATNVFVSDSLPVGLSYVAASIDAMGDDSLAPTLSWTLPSLAMGSTTTLSYQATLDAGTEGQRLTNIAVAACTDCNTNQPPSTNIITASTTADVVIQKFSDVSNAAIGDTITYTLTVSNTGPSLATNILVSDSLPVGLSYVAASIDGSGDDSLAPTLSWTLPSLAIGASTTLSYQATLDAGTEGQSLTNIAVAACADCNTNQPPSTNIITASTTADVVIQKTSDVSNAAIGDTITYTLTVTNAGPSLATNILVSDSLPVGLSYVAASIDASGDDSLAPTLSWTLPSLAMGSITTLSYQATLDAGTEGQSLTNIAVAACTDCNTNQPPSTNIITASATADVLIQKSSDVSSAAIGDTITYTLTLTNAGPSLATNILVSDFLPVGLSYVAASIDASGDDSLAPTLSWTLPSLAMGSITTLSYQATLDAGTEGQSLTNIAVAACTDCNTNQPPSTNIITASTTADVVIQKTSDVSNAAIGDTITYTLTLTNAGPSLATNILVSDSLPVGLSYVAASIDAMGDDSLAPTLSWTLPALAMGSTTTLSYQATLDAGTEGQSLTNIAVAACADCNTNQPPSTNIITASTTADVVIQKTSDVSNAAIGDTITYTLTLTNAGPSLATNILVSDSLPVGLSYVAASIDASGDDSLAPTLSWTLPSLAMGSITTLSYQATLDAGTEGQSLTNIAVAACTDCNTNQPPSTNIITASTTADVVIQKTSDVSNAAIGDTITYTLTLTNAGPSLATNILVSDSLPVGLSYVAASIDAMGDDSLAPTLSWTLPALAMGSTTTLSYQATLDAGTEGQSLTNIAVAACADCNTNQPPSTNIITASTTADVVIQKTSDVSNAAIGDTITYTLTLTNAGPSLATNILVSDSLPVGLSYVAASIDASGDDSLAPTLSWTLPALAIGSTTSLTYQATLDAGTEGQSLTNIAVAACADCNTNQPPSTNIITASTTADVVIQKASDVSNAAIGDTITYTLTLTNAGPSLATNILVSDSLPVGLSYVAASIDAMGDDSLAPTLSWTLPALAMGSTTTLSYQATLDAGTEGQSLTNIAVAACADCNTNQPPSTNIITASTTADVVIQKASDVSNAAIGDTITYTLTLTNAGPSLATNILVSDFLPVGLSYVAASIDAMGDDSLAPTLSWTLPALAMGSTTTLSYQATLDAGTEGQSLTNIAVATCADCNTNQPPSTNIITASTTADVVIQKVSDVSNAAIGDTITYTLTVSNTGPSLATNILVSDSLPVGLSYVAASIDASGDDSLAPTLSWTLPALAIGSTTSLTYQATLDAGTEGQSLTNIAVAACADCNTNQPPSTNIITASTTADVAIQKASDVSNAAIGDTITYTLTVSNTGPSLATNILVSDSLPVGLSYVAASIDAMGDDSLAPTLSWTLPALAMGSTTTLSYQATLDAGTEGQSLTNIAVAACADCNTNQPPSTNIITASTTADVVIQKASDVSNAAIGDTITYTLTLTNAGPSLATNILVSDFLPVGLSYVAASIDAMGDDSLAPTLSWTLPALAMGSTTTLSYQATLDAGTEGQSLTNIAVATCADCNTNQPPSTNIITASTTADVVIQKVSDVSNAAIGDTITYTLTLSNTGPSLATNVFVSDTLPVGLTYLAASIDASGDDSLAPTLSWTLPSLAMGGTTTLSYQATLDAGTEGQSLTNIAVAACADCNTNQPPSTNIITASTTADVVIQKASDVSSAAIGDTITYTLTLSNAGPSLATNVFVSDTLPVGLTYVAASIDAMGDDSLAPTLSWTLPALAMGSTTTLSYQATLDAGTEGQSLTNIAVAACMDCNTNQPPSTNIITASTTADVVIQKVSDVTNPAIGDTITYTLTLTNTGPSLATNVFVSDTLPVGLSYVAASIDAMGDDSLAPTLSWTLPALAMGSTTTLSYQATLDAGTEGQSLTNIAVAACMDCNTNQPPSTNIITASTTADVVIQKVSDVTNPAIGDTITYTLTLTNTGPSLATNVFVSDTLPVGLSYVAASIDAMGDDSLAPTLSWTLPSLAIGASTTLSYQATLDAGSEGQSLTNIAVAACADCNTNQPPSTNIITASATADVLIQKASDVSSAAIGDTITYTLTLTNAGPSLATNILVSDFLPVGLSYVAASIDASGDDSLAPTLSWSLPALAMGSTTTLSYQATLDAGTEGQSLTNIAVAACADCNTNQPPSTNIITASATADVLIQKASDVSSAAIGDTITYTLTLTNAGPSLATNILVSDFLPVGLSYVAASIDASGDDSLAPTLSWTLPALAMGSTTTLSYQATLDAGTEGQSLTNIAVAACADCNTNQPPSTNIITASTTADVLIQKASDVSNAAIGDTITYTLTLTNAGPSLATNILVSDSLPVGLSYLAASIDASGDDSLAPTLSWTLPALAMGSTTTLSYQATLDAGTEGQSLTNIAVAACADCNTNQIGRAHV